LGGLDFFSSIDEEGIKCYDRNHGGFGCILYLCLLYDTNFRWPYHSIVDTSGKLERPFIDQRKKGKRK
jgi:hypothetical protein